MNQILIHDFLLLKFNVTLSDIQWRDWASEIPFPNTTLDGYKCLIISLLVH
jgi:hypothetical protein